LHNNPVGQSTSKKLSATVTYFKGLLLICQWQKLMTNCQLLQLPTGSERCVVHCSVGSSWCATVCFTTTKSNGGFENGKPGISENNNSFQKCATTNTGCDVKKQQSQTEMTAVRAVSIHRLSQSWAKLNKLLE
jgi:hypothetical protein